MALILNGTNHYANGALTTSHDSSLGCSYAVTFKTGATVTGVRQTIACLNIASGNFVVCPSLLGQTVFLQQL